MKADAGDSPLRILYSHYLHDDNHPAARMVHSIASELRELGHEVKVHRCRGPVGHEKAERARARTADPSPLARLRDRTWFARALWKNRAMYRRDLEAIESFRPDVILGREDSYWFSTAMAAAKTGVPLVTYADVPVAYETRLFHGNERWNPPGVVEFVERFWLRRSRAVVTVCRPAARVLENMGVPVPIHVAWNGVDSSRFPVLTPEQRAENRERIGMPTGKTIIGFQGSFRNFHGIDLLRDVMLSLSERSDVHWLLVGDGPELGPLRESVSGRVSATFLGRQAPERMGELIGVFDIAVATHMKVRGAFYFCPLKILEYAAAGCAIVASTQGDIPALLDDGRAGRLVDDHSPEAWVDAIRELLDSPDRARELGSAARSRAVEKLSWKRTAQTVESVLRRSLSSESGRQETSIRARGARIAPNVMRT